MTDEGSATPPGKPFDFGMATLTEFWSQAGKVAMDAQQQAGRMMADAMKAVPATAAPGEQGAAGGFPLPGFPAFSMNPAEMGQAGTAMAELWTAATGLSGSISKMLMGQGGGQGGSQGAGQGAGQTGAMDASLRAMADPRTWLSGMGGLDGVAGAFAQGPRLADLWNTERQHARTMQAWMDVRRRALEHNAVLLEAWMKAGHAFTEELTGRTRAEGRMPDGKAVQALWIETANRVLLEAQRSQPFLQTQAATIRAGTEMRLAQTEAAEHWADGLGLPTRTELDDVHRALTTLRREVRTLQRQLREAAAKPAHGLVPTPEATPTPEAAPIPQPAPPSKRVAVPVRVKKKPEGVR